MRVTQHTLQDSWVSNLQKRLSEMDRLNKQIGSGSKISKPSDDPVAASRLIRIESNLSRTAQYQKNINETLSVHNTTDSALSNVYQLMVRAKSLALEGSSDPSVSTSESFTALADEVGGIKQGILQLASTKLNDKYVFSGTAVDAAPFSEEGGPYQGNSEHLWVNSGNGIRVAVNHPGDIAFRETEVWSDEALPQSLTLAEDSELTLSDGTNDINITLAAGVYSPIQVATEINDQIALFEEQNNTTINTEARITSNGELSIGIRNIGGGGEISIEDVGGSPSLATALGLGMGEKNIFVLLDDLKTALESEDSSMVGGLLDRMDRGLADIAAQRGIVGARSRNLGIARDRMQSLSVEKEALKAELEGVDMAEAVMRISAEENAYQTALAAGARIFNISIIDFLR